MAPIEELDNITEAKLKMTTAAELTAAAARKTPTTNTTSSRARASTPPVPPSTQLRKDSTGKILGKADNDNKTNVAQPAQALKTRPRSLLWHLAVATFFLGGLFSLVFFQNQIKQGARPVFSYLEHSLFARTFMWALLFMIPEPSPVVMAFATWVAWGNFDSVYKAVTTWVCESYGQFFLFHGLLPAVVLPIYYINGFLCLWLELQMAPEWINKYRIQPNKVFDVKKLPALLKRVTFNFLFVVPPVTATYHRAMSLRYDEELPSPLEVVCSIFSYIAANEVYFYYIHSLMHRNKTLYGLVHKVHHEYKQPIALASLYAHPLEVSLVILGQFTIGPILFGGHFYTIFLWTCSVVMVSQTHHCGFHWPWIPVPKGEGQPEFHDLHHEKFNMNYGSFDGKYSLDGLHGTLCTDPWAPAEKQQ